MTGTIVPKVCLVAARGRNGVIGADGDLPWRLSSDMKLFRDGAHGHLDLPRMKAGGFCGGFFALFAPSAGMSMDMSGDSYDLPLPPLMARDEALAANIAQAGILLRLERLGHLRILRRAADLPASIEAGEVSAILHLEGADCIDPEFRALDVLQGAGLRSLGPVWSRNNIWAHGAPFRFPSSPVNRPALLVPTPKRSGSRPMYG